ncbi:LysR family transcriptional regulator [Serratia sp. T13T92]|uniref:LysR family transcriptional regulator n=1 Tax=Serratia sp. T13T92 TaxID=3397496 RepID=UPI0039E14FD3
MKKLQFKLRDLKIISVIAETRSIGGTATLLGIAQANVSKHLSDFENRIGLKVFERTTRYLALTQFGEALVPFINASLEKHEDLANFISDYKHEKRGRVTIYGPIGIISYLSKSVIHEIKDIGDIHIHLKTYNLNRHEFFEGAEFPDDCDILITNTLPKDENLVASYLTKYAVTAYATQEYLNRHPIKSPEELESHSCILIDSMMIDDANIWRFYPHESDEPREFRVTGNYICDNSQTAFELARNNLGIFLAHKDNLQQYVKQGIFIPCFNHKYEWRLDLIAIFRKREYQPWRVQYVLDSVLETLRRQIEQDANRE